MSDLRMLLTALTHTLYGRMHAPVRRADGRRDRGAVSLEQVLWFVAAGVSVAVIATIVWNQIKTQANTTVDTPKAP